MGVREWGSQQDPLVKLLVVVGLVIALIVALVVVLVIVSALLGAFVLGLGAESGTAAAPDASFSALREADGDVLLEHDEGESLNDERVSIRIVNGDERTVDWQEANGRIDPGDDLRLNDVDSDATVEVRWETDDGETVTLAEFVSENA